MSASVNRMPLACAEALASCIRDELAPGCARIEIAGSIRRKGADIGDIEIVAIAAERPRLEVGKPADLLSPILDRLEKEGHFAPVAQGRTAFSAAKFLQFELPKARGLEWVKLDLFLTDAARWGCILAIRTGPQDFSRRLVTKQSLGGLCPDNLCFRGGRLLIVHGGVPVSTPEERDVFRALQVPYLEPWERR